MYQLILKLFLTLAFSFLTACLLAQPSGAYQTKEGNPADHLPEYIKRVSGFGERPEWSFDGKKILFVEKPMGEVYELDLSSGLIYPKTRHFNHFGFTRANYLSNGDILLSGPNEPFDPTDPEERNVARDMCWLSVLDQKGSTRPTPLNVVCAEGAAVSRNQLKIAWAIRGRQKPEFGENHARLYSGEIDYSSGTPKLVNQKMVFDSHQLPFNLGGASLETQDLVPPDDEKLVFSVYRIESGNNTDTYMLDLETGEFQNLTRSPGYYDEPEGIYPDGEFTLVEHGSSEKSAWPLIDMYKLKLDGSGEMQRLTYFTEYKGFKASQGIISDDGKYMCFQLGKSGDEAGVGYGFFIMDLEQAAPHFGEFKSYASPPNQYQVAANEFIKAWKEEKPLPVLTEIVPEITLDQAYNVQRSWVINTLAQEGAGGVKGAMVTPQSQSNYGLDEPMAAILRGNGKITNSDNNVILRKDYPNLSVETEIGFIVGETIDDEISSLEEFKQHITGIAPIIELPAGKTKAAKGPVNVANVAGTNVRSMAYIVGDPVAPDQIDPRQASIRLLRNGEVLHEATGADCWEGPWQTAFFLAGFAHRQGIILEPGDVIICGALGKIHDGTKGKYLYQSDLLGEVAFTIK